MATHSVPDIVCACQQGSRDGQRALYDVFQQRIYRLALRIVGKSDAEDLAQQIFLRVFQNISQFNHQSTFDTWLYRVATNQCLQHLRSRKTKQEESLPEENEHASEDGTNQVDLKDLLQVALQRLEPDLRAVLVLREIDQLNYGELAVALNISEGTVASRLNRARKHFRELLIDLGWET